MYDHDRAAFGAREAAVRRHDELIRTLSPDVSGASAHDVEATRSAGTP